MKVREATGRLVLEHGVDTMFGLLGDANLFYAISYQQAGGRFVSAVHEGGAVGMADAYSRITGNVGVASVTRGPGLTNTLTSLTEAVRNRSRLIVISAEPPSPTHAQMIDPSSVASTAGAGYSTVHSGDTLVRDLNRVFQHTVAEGRPFVLNLPERLMNQDAPEELAVTLPVTAPPLQPAVDALDGALGLMASAKRPVVLAGRGAVIANARESLVGLADLLGAALATTMQAKDMFAGHPRNLGVLGSLSHSVTSDAITSADVIIAFGAAINSWTTFGGELIANARIIHVDRDASRLGRFFTANEAICGDAALTATKFAELLAEADHRASALWGHELETRLAKHSPSDDFTDRSRPGAIDPRTAMIHLDEVLPRSRTVISDLGRFLTGTWPYVTIPDAADFVTPTAFGSIGLALGAAVGAAVARPDRVAVCLVGDGGLMMQLGEFSTAVREKLPVVVLAFNDGAYGAEHAKLVDHGIDPSYSLLACPDLAQVAESLGGRGARVESVDDIKPLASALADMSSGPLLVDVRLDPELNTMHSPTQVSVTDAVRRGSARGR